MKTLLIIISFIVFGHATAQDIKILPVHNDIELLTDGWYKFELEDAYFDVEILQGKYAKGNIIWKDGTSYSGNLNGQYISGRGTYIWSSGMRYEGAFKKGKRHGKGSLILLNGTKWSGKWKQNLKNGKGKIFNSKGDITDSGVWDNDERIS